MRPNRFPWPRDRALALLAAADSAHFALLDDDAPLLRRVHTVLDDGALCFHAGPVGAKLRGLGRPAVAAVERVLAVVPSYAFDPERACPATTWYQSVQVRGTLERVEDPPRKARILQALMQRLQPEGGHAPVVAEHPLYRKAIAGLEVLALPLTVVEGRAKLGQNRSDAQVCRALEFLWRRGDAGIDAAIAELLDAIRDEQPELPTPAFLRGPDGVQLCPRPRADELDAAVALLADAYWNDEVTPAQIRQAHQGAPVWVGARDHGGALIASARAIGDGSKHAWIDDVVVAPEHRGRGVGRALLGLLLDHPQLREVRTVHLHTRDAGGFHGQLGFAEAPAARTTHWQLRRGPAQDHARP